MRLVASYPITAGPHQYEEDDVVLVRMAPDGNLTQDEYYSDDTSKARRRKAYRSENWVWYAGVVTRVAATGKVKIEFYDGDYITLTPEEVVTEVRRTTGKRLANMFGDAEFEGVITNGQAYDLAKGNLKTRELDEVLEVEEGTLESELMNPVAKMVPDMVKSVYEEHDWLGAWVLAPIYDASKKKHILPACMIGFGMVRGKHCLILKTDTSGNEGINFKTPWTTLEIFDRNPEQLYDKLDRLASSAKSKVSKFGKMEKADLKSLITMRREAKKSKRFI